MPEPLVLCEIILGGVGILLQSSIGVEPSFPTVANLIMKIFLIFLLFLYFPVLPHSYFKGPLFK